MDPIEGSRSRDPETVLQLTAARVDRTVEGVIVMTLSDDSGSQLPEWEPGAHIDVIVDDAFVRQYSLCGDPSDRSQWQIAVRRVPDGRGGSIHLHDNVIEGSRWKVRGPRNAFPLATGRQRYLFIAGGIGITPLLPMIEAVSERGVEWQMFYGGRTRASMPFVERVSRHGDRVRVLPEDHCGLLDLAGLFDAVESGTAVYCCGPEPLIAAMEERCRDREDISLHVERFAPRPDDQDHVNTSFDVYCASSDLTLHVPADRSILEVAQEAGADVVSSCMEGTCGTCEVDVLAGEPDHRDSFLSPQERASSESMLICVSRCAGMKLTLDI